MKKLLKQLFFYSSRQLYRRWRAYLSIFLTSVVLLTLVMTFLQLCESMFLRSIEISKQGYHHVLIRGMTTDYDEDVFLKYNSVESAFIVPYTSLMASSNDTTVPARVVVETDEIDDYFNVRYIWGEAPKDGEIAVSQDLYKAYDYLTAGEVNDLYFKATEMTYFPLKISGIFECSYEDAGYAFINKKTASAIDSETGAKIKNDIYLRFKNSSDRSIAKELDKIMKKERIPDTDWQSRRAGNNDLTKWSMLKQVYAEYINSVYLDTVMNQQAAPVVLISMPVIAVAALMLASFVSNWMKRNAPEYGILSAVGANRRQLCWISAGTVMLISLAASVPVILFSAGISNIYISIYNAASSIDVDFIYKIPWGKFIEAALWFTFFSCLFTYIGISKMTGEFPFVLISGSYRSKLPFVKRTSQHISAAKDKIRAISFTTALRELKQEIIYSVISSLICIVGAVFILFLILFKSSAASNINLYSENKYDVSISSGYNFVYDRIPEINSNVKEQVKSIKGIESCAGYSFIEYFRKDNSKTPVLSFLNENINCSAVSTDPELLPYLYGNIISGEPESIFDNKNRVIIMLQEGSGYSFDTGDIIKISGSEFETAAVVTMKNDLKIGYNTPVMMIFNRDDADSLGFIDKNEYDRLICNFDKNLSDGEIVSITEAMYSNPQLMRYDIENYRVMTESEKQIDYANTYILTVFFGMLYLSYCVMTYSDSCLKILKKRGEISVLRQIGADDKKIYKTVRTQTYPASLLALIITTAIFIVIIYALPSYQLSELYKLADMYPLTYTEEVVAEIKTQVYAICKFILLMFVTALPIHFISALVRLLGTVMPTRRILKESIIDGIRKDTD